MTISPRPQTWGHALPDFLNGHRRFPLNCNVPRRCSALTADAGYAGSSLYECGMRDAGRHLPDRRSGWCERAGHWKSKIVSRPVLDTTVLRVDCALLFAAGRVTLVQEFPTRVGRPAQIEVTMVIAHD